eukprot:13480700-Ditylum_brightwellii.AAC.1
MAPQLSNSLLQRKEDLALDEILKETKESWVIATLPDEVAWPTQQQQHEQQPKYEQDNQQEQPLPSTKEKDTVAPPSPFVVDPVADSLQTWGTAIHKDIIYNENQSTDIAVVFDQQSFTQTQMSSTNNNSTGEVSKLTAESQLSAMEQSISSHHNHLVNISMNMAGIMKMLQTNMVPALAGANQGSTSSQLTSGSLTSFDFRSGGA